VAVGFGLTSRYNGEGVVSRVAAASSASLPVLVGWTQLTMLAIDQGRRFSEPGATTL
jgi:hypothetical protein